MDHFKKPLQETCPNHTYPIKHKLREHSMMKSVMTSGSLSRGMEVDKGPNERDGHDDLQWPPLGKEASHA
jgi:hypothetical protein